MRKSFNAIAKMFSFQNENSPTYAIEKSYYNAPEFDQEYFKSTFQSVDVPIVDRFRIKPVPSSVVDLTKNMRSFNL